MIARCLLGVDQYVALKCIVRSSSPERIEREIECLFTLRYHHIHDIMLTATCSGDNPVANVLGVVRDRDTVVLILDYFEHEPFKVRCLQLCMTESAW